ncbi:MAG: LysR substrate-binding domain-containing protein [Acidimicrobiia bacterium]
MELRHLRYFLAVAEELSFTRAAARLRIAQPPLSQQIRQLEDELGVELIERGARPLRLTAAGVLLLKRARVIVADVYGCMEEARRVGRGQTGRLVIAFVGSAMYSFLPDVFTRFGKAFPHVELILHEMLAADIAGALHARRIDVGFSRPPLEPSDEFSQKLLLEEPFVLAVPEKHPFATRESVNLRELDNEPLILYPRYPLPSTTEFVLRACAAAGFPGRVIQEVRHIQTAIGLVSAGIGLTWVPRSVGQQSRRGVCFVPFQPPAPIAALFVAWHKNTLSVLLENFLGAVESELSSYVRAASIES